MRCLVRALFVCSQKHENQNLSLSHALSWRSLSAHIHFHTGTQVCQQGHAPACLQAQLPQK